MCGIAGVLRSDDRSVARAHVAGMLDRIGHRGPDGRGMWLGEGIGLGHVRLAILDLSDNAAQPMVSHCGRFVLTFNGEIYNYRSLQRALEPRGIRLRSTGDTEVLLEYLVAFGVEATLPLLEGFFAFGLWDTQERSLVLARDRHGIKPLYYKRVERTGVEFASEIKALLGSDTELEHSSVSAALVGSGSVLDEHTLFRSVLAVRPGQWRKFCPGVPDTSASFLQLKDFIEPELRRELDQAPTDVVLDRIVSAFRSSIDLRMISDAPVACLASGGVDSSLVVSMAIESRGSPINLHHTTFHTTASFLGRRNSHHR